MSGNRMYMLLHKTAKIPNRLRQWKKSSAAVVDGVIPSLDGSLRSLLTLLRVQKRSHLSNIVNGTIVIITYENVSTYCLGCLNPSHFPALTWPFNLTTDTASPDPEKQEDAPFYICMLDLPLGNDFISCPCNTLCYCSTSPTVSPSSIFLYYLRRLHES